MQDLTGRYIQIWQFEYSRRLPAFRNHFRLRYPAAVLGHDDGIDAGREKGSVQFDGAVERASVDVICQDAPAKHVVQLEFDRMPDI